jgi:hypothetical protein
MSYLNNKSAIEAALIGAQGVSFVNITSNIMIGIFSVALACKYEHI